VHEITLYSVCFIGVARTRSLWSKLSLHSRRTSRLSWHYRCRISVRRRTTVVDERCGCQLDVAGRLSVSSVVVDWWTVAAAERHGREQRRTSVWTAAVRHCHQQSKYVILL